MGRAVERATAAQTPEFRCLVEALRWPRGPDEAAAMRTAATQVLSWPHVRLLAERHRVVGLLHNALHHAGVEVRPASEADLLMTRAQEVRLDELRILAELIRIKRAFEKVGLATVVLKGPAAALQGFGRIGLRTNRDIDLLVEAHELQPAQDVLGNLGFVRVEPVPEAGAAELAAWVRRHKDMVFIHQGGAIVELHWRLFDNPVLLPSLQNAARVSLPLTEARSCETLSGPDAFLYMSVHGAQHAWSRLKWLADLNALRAAMGEEAVAEAYRTAKRAGVSRAVGQGLLLCADLFRAPLPVQTLEDEASDAKLRWLYALAVRVLRQSEVKELEETRFGSTLKSISHYLLADGSRYWVHQLAYDLNDLSAVSTPRALRWLGPLAKAPVWLYRRARPVRLARR